MNLKARWEKHDLQVAQKSREERMVELSTKPKEVKKDEKILPAKLPAVWIRHVLQQCLDAFIQSLVTLNYVNKYHHWIATVFTKMFNLEKLNALLP